MKVWITKYALTNDILEVDGTVCENGSGQMLRYIGWGHPQYVHGEGREWHRTHAGAIARAEAMRTAKIASLRKSIAKMEGLVFGVTEGSDKAAEEFQRRGARRKAAA